MRINPVIKNECREVSSDLYVNKRTKKTKGKNTDTKTLGYHTPSANPLYKTPSNTAAQNKVANETKIDFNRFISCELIIILNCCEWQDSPNKAF